MKLMSDDLDDLYQQVILDHCKSPRNFHALEGANRKGEGYNPLCGDNYTVFLKMDGDVVRTSASKVPAAASPRPRLRCSPTP